MRTPGSTHVHRSSNLHPLALLLGALTGGGASLCAAVYTQRNQNGLQRVASEIAKRETVYADFVVNASNMLLNAYVRDEILLGVEEQRLDRAHQSNEAVCSA
jgi:hypothetical protein